MKPSSSYPSTTGSSHNTDSNDGVSRRLAAFPYRGGKFHLAPKLVKLLPSHRVYVEVFGGAASVLLAKPLSQIEVYNDNNGLLVNLFETVRNRPSEFLDRAWGIPYSRELYEKWRKDLASGLIITNLQNLLKDQVEVAVKTFYCLVSSFVGDPTKGWAFQRHGRDGGPNRWLNIQERVVMLHDRFRHVALDHLDFRDCIKNWDSEETLFFLDPPYLSTKSHGFYRNFTLKDHQDLAALLRTVKAKWLMTLDEGPRLRELYRGFNIQTISTILASQKVPKGTSRVQLKQILISNFETKLNVNA